MLKYVKNGRSVTLPMGSQARADDNLRILYLAVEAMRMNDKRGLGEVIQEAYLQLAGPEPTIDPYQLLGIRPDASIEFAEAAWKFLMKTAHPDAGGSEEQVKKLNAAIEQVRKERQV
jgi:DnaJ-domain-containing protein 1